MTLLICDDDISTIDVLQSQLDCGSLGIDRILRAYNGEVAKEILEKERPELVLCDIGMPRGNGLSVLKFVYDRGIPTEFAFLTCYEDFEYAREAMRYGAVNYLTKPVDFGELDAALRRMTAAARERQRLLEQQEDPALEDSRVNNLLRQIQDGFFGSNRERIDAVLRKNRVKYNAMSPMRLVMLAGDATDSLRDGWEREMLAYSFCHLAEEALTDHVGLRSTVLTMGDRFLHSVTFVPAETCGEADLMQRARMFIRLSSMNLSMLPVAVIGEECPLYLAADRAADLRSQARKIVLQRGSAFLLRDVRSIPEGGISILEEEQLLRLIRQRDKAAYLDMINGALEKIVFSRKDNKAMMATLHQDLMQALYDCLRDNGISVRLLLQNEQVRSLEQDAERSQADMLSFASVLFDACTAELSRNQEATDAIAAVKRYIMEHYREDIDRNDVAAVAYITPNYLSKRFRAEMGMSLREYINQLRIEEAKRLLLSTGATISEVASAVGYDNISYFSTVFRKICGMSPIEWCGGHRREGVNP